MQSHQKEPQLLNDLLNNKKIASINEVCEWMEKQLQTLVKCITQFPSFSALQLVDQAALLRAHAGDLLVLALARRSLHLNDYLILSDDYIIPRASSEVQLSLISARIIDNLIKPLRDVQIDETEFACLKALVFFDPGAHGLSDAAKVRQLRYQVQLNLEDYINDRQYESRGRCLDIAVIPYALESITRQMIEQIQFAELFGMTKINNQMQELLLGGRPIVEPNCTFGTPTENACSNALATVMSPSSCHEANNSTPTASESHEHVPNGQSADSSQPSPT